MAKVDNLVGRPRLLVLTERYFPEQFLVNELVEEFSSFGFEVTVLTQVPSYPMDKLYSGYPNRWIHFERSGRTRIIRVRTVLGYKSNEVAKVLNYVWFALATYVTLALTGCRYDAVFAFHTGPLTLCLPVFACIGPRSQRLLWTQDVWPDTVFEYGLSPRGTAANLLRRFVRATYARFGTIAVTSPGFLGPVQRYSTRSEVIFVPQWAPKELLQGGSAARMHEQQQLPGDAIVFRFAGAVGTMQNLTRVLDGFWLATKVDNRLVLEIIGDGSDLAFLVSRVKREGIPQVRFLGRLPMQEVMPLLKESHALVLSLVGSGVVSRTIPAKFQAYLAAQRPILAIAGGAVGEIVKKADLGLQVDSTKVDSIRDGFLELAQYSKERINEIRMNEIDYLKNEYSKSKAVARFVAVLRGSLDAGTIVDS